MDLTFIQDLQLPNYESEPLLHRLWHTVSSLHHISLLLHHLKKFPEYITSYLEDLINMLISHKLSTLHRFISIYFQLIISVTFPSILHYH